MSVMKVVGGFASCWIGSLVLLFITTIIFAGTTSRMGSAALSGPLTMLGIFDLLVGIAAVVVFGWLIRDVQLGFWRYVAIGGLLVVEAASLLVLGFMTLVILNR